MRTTLRLACMFATALICARAVATAPSASPSAKPFVAPGLWQIVSDVQGPMQQRSQITQQACWNAQGESGEAFPALSGGRVGQLRQTVSNPAHRSTVHLHGVVPMPQAGRLVQDITMVFTRSDSARRQASMTGHGSMTGMPVLDETFTQHGHWLAASCPAAMPPAQTRTLQAASLPGIAALQRLASQLQAQHPHGSGP